MNKFMNVGLVAALAVTANLMMTSPASANDKNHPSYWAGLGYGTCVKTDGVNSKTFTVPALASGKVYSLAVVKASTDHQTDTSVKVGDVLRHSGGKDISHVTLCYKAAGSVQGAQTEIGKGSVTNASAGSAPAVTKLPSVGSEFAHLTGAAGMGMIAYLVALRKRRLS